MGFRWPLQSKEGLLLLLMPSLHFIVLLLKHFSVVLGNVRVGGRRHDNTETRAKKLSFSVYVFVDLGTITRFLGKPNRTSKAQS